MSDRISPRQLFEDVAVTAAGNYLKGHGLRFGWPRKDISRAFKDAVNSLCTEYIREGKGFREQPVLYSKDNKVDLVAWTDSPDRLPGKLLMFGACASGSNWKDKRTELNPDSFCKKWMIEQPPSPLIKGFFVPHRMERQYWTHYSWDAGIIFDRCRIAFWADSGPNRIEYLRYSGWIKAVLQGIKDP